MNLENLVVNDLVIVKDNRLAPNEWMLERLVKTYEGIDKTVRVVDVKTSTGLFSRPITKIVKLFSD